MGRIEQKIDTLKDNIVEEMVQKLTGQDAVKNKVNLYLKTFCHFF